jgi:hypothetical protein
LERFIRFQTATESISNGKFAKIGIFWVTRFSVHGKPTLQCFCFFQASQEAYSYLDPPKPINYPLNSSLNSFNSEPLSTYINPFSYGTTQGDHKRYEKEQHRLDLLRQIEDNNRRKMLEKQRDWEEDQKERWR